MSLAQDIRLAYEHRGREELERLLRRVDLLEAAHNAEAIYQKDERCTCQKGPTWHAYGAIGEPMKCAFCKKPLVLTADVSGPMRHYREDLVPAVAAAPAPHGLQFGRLTVAESMNRPDLD